MPALMRKDFKLGHYRAVEHGLPTDKMSGGGRSMKTEIALVLLAISLVAGFAAGVLTGREYPARRYVHIGGTTMYNERTGRVCTGIKPLDVAAALIDPNIPKDYKPDPAPFCGEEDKE
jgi:hypothetical protein